MGSAQTAFLTVGARRFAVGVFSFALVLRIVFTAVFLVRGLDISYGRDLYYNLALSWLGWAPPFSFDATHPPLYTALIASILGLFRSPSPLPVLAIQCAVGAACAPMTCWLGRRLVDEKTARLSAFWVALDPGLLFFTPQLGTETVFIAMELLFVLWLLNELRRPVSARLALVGLWGGLSALCRSVIGGYPAFLFIVLWRTRGFIRAFLFCAVLGIGWLAPSIGWSVRNYFKYGKMIPVAASMGWNMYEGFSTDREEIRRRPIEMGQEAAALGLLEDPIGRGDHFARKTTTFIRTHPAESLRIVAGKAFLFWRPWPYDPHSWWQRSALGAYFTFLFVLAAFGAVTAWPNREWAPVWALFAYLTFLHSFFFTSLRYRLPLEPFLCLLAASGLVDVIRRRKASRG